MAGKDYGIPGFDANKGGAVARARAALNNSAQGSMTDEEYKSYLRRKALEDMAQANRDKAANQNKPSASSDLMGKIFGN